MKILNDNWLIFDDKMSLSKALAQEVLNIAKISILKNNRFSIVLTGGQSVLDLYKILSESKSDWDKWHIYIGDERFLPAEHKDRNDRVINNLWLDHSTIPRENIHFIQAELGLFEARLEYENVLKKIDKFDIVLLSMGEDGHVASLFPSHSYSENQAVIIESNSPKLPKQRLSMSYKRLNKSNYVFKLIVGKENFMSLLYKNKNIPILKVKGECEKLYIYRRVIC
jgi:6-phosphogluconolactonase